MSTYNLFLDDVRKPKDVRWIQLPPVNWEIARSYDEFVKIVTEKGLPDIVSFDHDLHESHYEHACAGSIPYDQYTVKTGYEAAKWLADHCDDNDLDFPEYYIHTLNRAGFRNIYNYIEGMAAFNLKGR